MAAFWWVSLMLLLLDQADGHSLCLTHGVREHSNDRGEDAASSRAVAVQLQPEVLCCTIRPMCVPALIAAFTVALQ